MGMKQKIFVIRPSFFVLTAMIMLFLGIRAALITIISIAIHELGHLIAVWLCGGSIRKLRIGALEAEIFFTGSFSYGKDILIALSGPIVSLIAAAISGSIANYFGFEDAYYLAGINLIYGLLNLLPSSPLDGGRVLSSILALLFGPFVADKIQSVFDLICCVIAMMAGIYVFLETGRNLTLLLCAILLISNCCKTRKSSVEFRKQCFS